MAQQLTILTSEEMAELQKLVDGLSCYKGVGLKGAELGSLVCGAGYEDTLKRIAEILGLVVDGDTQ